MPYSSSGQDAPDVPLADSTVFLNGHALTVGMDGEITLDDPAADTDPSIVEDRARLYRIDCYTCCHLDGAVDRAIAQRTDLTKIAGFARNLRTGEWLNSHRPGIDDPSHDTLRIVVEHCSTTIVCLLGGRSDRLPVLLGTGDPIAIDEQALATSRVMAGLGRSPWETVRMYRDITDPQ